MKKNYRITKHKKITKIEFKGLQRNEYLRYMDN